MYHNNGIEMTKIIIKNIKLFKNAQVEIDIQFNSELFHE